MEESPADDQLEGPHGQLGAAVLVIERLSLLGGLVKARDAPAGQREDRLLGGASSPRHGLAPAMEEADRNAGPARERHQADLDPPQLRAGGEQTRLLARIAVADHDFLVAAGADVLAIHRIGQDLLEDLGARGEVLSRLEERHHVHGHAAPACIPEARRAGAVKGGQDVARRGGHGEDQGLAGIGSLARQIPHPPQGGKEPLAPLPSSAPSPRSRPRPPARRWPPRAVRAPPRPGRSSGPESARARRGARREAPPPPRPRSGTAARGRREARCSRHKEGSRPRRRAGAPTPWAGGERGRPRPRRRAAPPPGRGSRAISPPRSEVSPSRAPPPRQAPALGRESPRGRGAATREAPRKAAAAARTGRARGPAAPPPRARGAGRGCDARGSYPRRSPG